MTTAARFAIALLLAAWVASGSQAAAWAAQQGTPAQPKFEVASVKSVKNFDRMRDVGSLLRLTPGPVEYLNFTLATAVQKIYGVSKNQYAGGPAWIETDRFTLEATASGAPPEPVMTQMLKTLIEQRFQLQVRIETRGLSGYTLRVAKGGLKMHEVQPDPKINYDAISMAQLARSLSNGPFRAPVVDLTGLQGVYPVCKTAGPHCLYQPVQSDAEIPAATDQLLEDKLGLTVKPGKVSVPFVQVLRASLPGPN